MQVLVTVVHVITCILLVLVVLLQSGKGAEISSSFAGSSQTVFGSSGGANFFTKFTSVAATLFMVTSVVLTIMGSESKRSVFEGMATPPAAESQKTGDLPVQGDAQAASEADQPTAQDKKTDQAK